MKKIVTETADALLSLAVTGAAVLDHLEAWRECVYESEVKPCDGVDEIADPKVVEELACLDSLIASIQAVRDLDDPQINQHIAVTHQTAPN